MKRPKQKQDEPDLGQVLTQYGGRKKSDGRISIPTGMRHHTTSIRMGKISAEAFCHSNKRRKELGLDPIPVDPDAYVAALRR